MVKVCCCNPPPALTTFTTVGNTDTPEEGHEDIHNNTQTIKNTPFFHLPLD